MAMNSVNTNLGAMVALQSLNRTSDALSVTQKRVSTGFRVSDAKDDGAAFAVAQGIRADVAGLTSANEQLGGIKGILDTTNTALKNVSDTMTEIRTVLVKLADDNTSTDQRTQYTAQFGALVDKVNRFLSDATYNGKSLIGTDENAATDVVTVRNESGQTFAVGQVAGATLTFDTAINLTTAGTLTTADGAFTLAAGAAMTALNARAMLGTGPAADLPDVRAGAGTATAIKTFSAVQGAVNTAMNRYGNDSKYVDAQITYNKDKLDSMESGLGALIDADLAKESARLQALQIKQQLGTQALGIANQTPQTLLSLFRS
ncbi:flagellin [Roseomonas sp. BN140053]|uniref:flagellin N-terminal helical domain-containing protein n=1 Tax=Roseomonas sp. BN140053 TaxID=3391898 RepID=UPI0039E7CBF6